MNSSSLRQQRKRSNHFSVMYRLCRLTRVKASKTLASANTAERFPAPIISFLRRSIGRSCRPAGLRDLFWKSRMTAVCDRSEVRVSFWLQRSYRSAASASHARYMA